MTRYLERYMLRINDLEYARPTSLLPHNGDIAVIAMLAKSALWREKQQLLGYEDQHRFYDGEISAVPSDKMTEVLAKSALWRQQQQLFGDKHRFYDGEIPQVKHKPAVESYETLTCGKAIIPDIGKMISNGHCKLWGNCKAKAC